MKPILLLLCCLGMPFNIAKSHSQDIASSNTEIPNINNSGTDFLRVCPTVEKANDTSISRMDFFCLGWASGFLGGVMTSTMYSAAQVKPFCPPEEITSIQTTRIVKKYIIDHPEKEHMLTGILATQALTQAFPCPK